MFSHPVNWQGGQAVSLFDLLNLISFYDIYSFLSVVDNFSRNADEIRSARGGDFVLPNEYIEVLCKLFGGYADNFHGCFPGLARKIQTLMDYLATDPTVAGLQSIFKQIEGETIAGLQRKQFIYVSDDRKWFPDNYGALLFGKEVHQRFPSALSDLKEAANCMAAECNTAAVFHLMRVAEVGLRTMAWDRRVKVINSKGRDVPFDLATWDEIIKELEKAETAIQGYKKSHAREAQFAFYHGALMEFKRFKNVWRNRIMHTREEHYDRHQARRASLST